MSEVRYACPDCGGIDLITTTVGSLITADGQSPNNNAECVNCGWTGKVSETTGFATTEKIWSIERIGIVLLRVMATRAAGPLVQALEFIGLLPRKFEEKESMTTEERVRVVMWNREAQHSRDAVMQRVCEKAITAAFEEAERQNRRFARVMGTDIHPLFAAEDKEHADKIRNRKERRKAKHK